MDDRNHVSSNNLMSTEPKRQKPELLAPAGNWDCARAAVENGADAIYFGLECGFNARARATNFSVDDLPELMDFLHRRNVSGYVTLNTLAFTNELPEVERLVRVIAQSGVDAMLVQDIGVARLSREICPELPLHASTQMTMTSAETIELAQQLGVERVVVARELSIDEIQQIRSQTDMPIETFVHGALCVAYSGQCLTSESLGGRSANRGQCAQACRLSYDLIADGEVRDLGEQQYLLSPQDLAAYELTPELLEAGVCSLKIEGRLKTPEYVANITKHYRHAIDAAFDRQQVTMTPQEKYDMEMSFSRGFSPGWLEGCDHKMLVPATSSAKRGVLAGTISKVGRERVEVDLACSVRPGDGIVFDGDRTEGAEQGGRIFEVFVNGRRAEAASSETRAELAFAYDAIDFSSLFAGQELWKTDDPKLNRKLRSSFDVADPVRRVPLDLEVQCVAGESMLIRGVATSGATCEVQTEKHLEVARKHAVTEEVVREQLGRLGGSVFELRNVDLTIEGSPMVPFSVFGEVRRAMTEQLETSPLKRARTIAADDVLDQLRSTIPSSSKPIEQTPRLRILCRTLDQVRGLSESGNALLYAELQDIREYDEAVTIAHANGATLCIATPRIQKPGEMGIFRSIGRHGADGYLVRNFAGLKFFREQESPIVADFSMNVANELTAQFLMDQCKTERVTASYDLNRDQLLDLVQNVPKRWLELVIHQHMPMFHMEHCVFCAVLSPGTNKTNCGRPCDTMQVELRDRIGMEHPLTADVGCRNTMWNATPQSSAEIVNELLNAGIGDFRVELLREPGKKAVRTVELYRKLLAKEIRVAEVWLELKASNRVGVTRGTLEERNPLAII